MRFLLALIVPDHVVVTVQLILERLENGELLFYFYSQTQGQKKWIEYVKGKLQLTLSINKKIEAIETIKQRCLVTENVENLYDRVIAMGMPAGESIRWTSQYWVGEKEILCALRQPETINNNDHFKLNIHPGIIDGCIQPIFKLLPAEFNKPFIASHVKKINYFGMQQGPLYLLSRLNRMSASSKKLIGTCYLINKDSEVLIEFEDFCLKLIDNKIQTEQIKQLNVVHHLDLSSLSEDARKHAITAFLIEQVASIFSMPAKDVETNRSLREMGLDSLMALVLLRTLEMGLGINYTLQAILEGATILQIVDVALNTLATPSMIKKGADQSNPWIAYRERRPQAKIRLFCFPYGGAGASVYRDWHRHLPEAIEICPIQFPGRENRLDEKVIGNIDALINILIHQLQHEFDLPFAFFGHSFGSLIAFELARTLRKQQLAEPSHLFAAAFPDPRLPSRRLDSLLQQLRTINLFASDHEPSIAHFDPQQLNHLSTIFKENGIVDYGDHLMNKEVVSVLLPVFIGDMSIIKSYQYRDEAPLDCPITVFLGKKDTWVAYEDHLKWVEHTRKKCEIHEFDSGHLFIKDDHIKQALFQKITNALKEFSTHD